MTEGQACHKLRKIRYQTVIHDILQDSQSYVIASHSFNHNLNVLGV